MIKEAIPNLITCGNITTGALGISNVFLGDPEHTIYFIIVAAGFDFLDGLAARLLGTSSPMGKELDSLADMVSFGVLPALFLFRYFSDLGMVIASNSAFLLVPFSAWRLAKFNIDTNQKDKFIGLPTPANAIMIASLSFTTLNLSEPVWVVATLTACFLLVANVEMIALKFNTLQFLENIWKYLLIGLSTALLLIWKQAGIALVIPLYVLLSIVANFAGKKAV